MTMINAKAVWNDTVLAESNQYEKVEGNVYFPNESVKKEYLEPSDTQYTCPWKGEAEYYHVVVNGQRLEDGAWSYPEPKPAANHIKGYIAFSPKVEIKRD